jgi:hypothetical protein
MLFAFLVSPAITAAQRVYNYNHHSFASSTALYDSSGTTPAQLQQIRSWRQTNGLQQKISVLPSVANSSVLMPVLFGVGINDISPNFGDPRDNGTRTHQGEDIMATKGTPIVSPTPAVVLRTETGVSEGNAVYTANPGGETFVYMHLDHFGEGVVSGLVLGQGSLIGYVGNTGNASGGPAHLHFEIHNSSGTPTDPFPRLTSEFTLAQKISFLSTILMQTSDPASLSQFLVTNSRGTFTAALAANIILPASITNALASIPGVGGGAVVFSRDLYYGISGEDVRILQRILNAQGFAVATSGGGSPGNETAYFGPATLAAVVRFQIAHNISPVVGRVGPLTRAALAAL